MYKKIIPLLIVPLLLASTIFCAPCAEASTTEDPTEIEFKLTFLEETKTVTLEDLGVSAIENGEITFLQENLFSSIAFFDKILSKRRYDFSWSKVRSEALVRDMWDSPKPKNARFIYKDGVLSINQEIDGYRFDINEVLEEITDDYPDLRSYEIETTKPDLIEAEEIIDRFSQVNDLLSGGLLITHGENTYTFPAQMKDIAIVQESDNVTIKLNEPFLNYVTTTLANLINQDGAQNLRILEADPSIVAHTVTEGHVQDGEKLIEDLTKELIKTTIDNGERETGAFTETTKGQVINETGHDLGPLVHLGTGISNFATSPYGRDYNVRRGLNEKFNNILIPPGGEFSYNSFLGPITYSAGWKGSLAIFGGTNLRTVPGGGLCQVSTTVYRAALDAGLDIKQQRNHSLYVHYYKEYGDGLDATIFPGSQDLVFINNTDNYIFMEAYDDGYDAIVKFYGEDDGREIYYDGPYTKSNQTDELIAAIGSLGYNEIAWKYTITWPDGRSQVEWLLSSYRTNVTQY